MSMYIHRYVCILCHLRQAIILFHVAFCTILTIILPSSLHFFLYWQTLHFFILTASFFRLPFKPFISYYFHLQPTSMVPFNFLFSSLAYFQKQLQLTLLSRYSNTSKCFSYSTHFIISHYASDCYCIINILRIYLLFAHFKLKNRNYIFSCFLT